MQSSSSASENDGCTSIAVACHAIVVFAISLLGCIPIIGHGFVHRIFHNDFLSKITFWVRYVDLFRRGTTKKVGAPPFPWHGMLLLFLR